MISNKLNNKRIKNYKFKSTVKIKFLVYYMDQFIVLLNDNISIYIYNKQ